MQVSEPWEMIGIDLMGPWKETKYGFKYLFTATDFFTKWVEAFPLREKSAVEVAQCLLKLFYRFGASKSVLHDNGKEFVNKVNRMWFYSYCHLCHCGPYSESKINIDCKKMV